MSEKNASPAPDAKPESKAETQAAVAKLIAEGKKAIALRQWDEGVGKYADALDLQRELVGDFDPSMAPLLLSYGKALYELALSQQGVMGREEVAKSTDPASADPAAPGAKGNFVFEGDGDDEGDEEEQGEEGEGEGEQDGGEEEGKEQGEGEEEPEDDFNAAWEVLDVARTIYAREVEQLPAGEGKETRLLLSECYLALGDVSCETAGRLDIAADNAENFDQAVKDYEAAVKLKASLLPKSSRALASAEYQLGTALEFTPAGRPSALVHVQAALDGFKARLAELTATTTPSPDVAQLGEKERDKERKDVEALIGDLEVKIEELKAAPEGGDIVSESINHLLGGQGGAVKADAGPVNDLTSMVKKKKKPAAPAAQPAAEQKRKAEEQGQGTPDKKAKN